MSEPAEERQPRKMLIADDDPAILGLLVDHCMQLGFQVETAMNGVQLLVKARQSHPDILVVDVKMPALDGLSVCARMLDSSRKPPAVIVITGADDPETVERCERLGIFLRRKGPSFWTSFEAALAEIFPDMAHEMEEIPAPPPNVETLQRPLVLVVDDDPGFERFLAGRLAKYGVDTIYARGATQACRMASRENPSVIIADNYMPDGDALFLLHRLRAAPATAAIPVFVVSARKLNDLEEQALKRDIHGRPGALHVFRKSFDTEMLFDALRKFCSFKSTTPPRPRAESEGW